MSYYATLTPSGTYQVSQVGGGIVSTVSAAMLPNYGLSTSNLGSSTPAPAASSGTVTRTSTAPATTPSVIPTPVAAPTAQTSVPVTSTSVNTYGLTPTSSNWFQLQPGESPANYNARVAAANPNLPAPGTTSTTGVTNTAAAAPSVLGTTINGVTPSSTTITQSSIQPTGNANLDAALGPLATQVAALATNGQIPSTLQITPALVGTFLSWAHSVVDPQTQQLLTAEAANINNSLQNAQIDYQNTQGETEQQFGTDLANEENEAGTSGTAFSGQRNLNEQNMVNSTNRTLSTNAADAALNVGNTLNAGAAAVGASNAGMFNLPTLAGAGTVSNTGGARGTYTPSGNSLDFGYNPSTYTAGTIPTSGATNVGNQEANYLGQYTTLAANNSNGTRSVNDLLGMITGAPAGATANLQ